MSDIHDGHGHRQATTNNLMAALVDHAFVRAERLPALVCAGLLLLACAVITAITVWAMHGLDDLHGWIRTAAIISLVTTGGYALVWLWRHRATTGTASTGTGGGPTYPDARSGRGALTTAPMGLLAGVHLASLGGCGGQPRRRGLAQQRPRLAARVAQRPHPGSPPADLAAELDAQRTRTHLRAHPVDERSVAPG
jgi:hypothetical protein